MEQNTPYGWSIEKLITHESLMDLNLKLIQSGKIEEAWKNSCRLMEEFPESDRAAFNHGWHLCRRGQLREGNIYIDRGRKAKCFGGPDPMTLRPRWDGQDISNKTILFNMEGGLGDQMISARFCSAFKDLYGAKSVVVACSPELLSPISRVTGVSAVVAHKAQINVHHDYWVPGMSAMIPLNMEYAELPSKPYLSSRVDYFVRWRDLIGNKYMNGSKRLRVGIRWSGNQFWEHEQHRTLPLKRLIDALSDTNIQLFSFQKDKASEEIKEYPQVIDISGRLATWDDTLAALQQMDLLVTSCTSIAHAAGALGVRTWVVIPLVPYYIWLYPGDNTSAWYGKNVRLYRQTEPKFWHQPLEQISKDIKETL